MIRERVDVHGRVRQLEPMEDIPSLQIPSDQMGLLREAPARRWLSGQEAWDRRYKTVGKRVEVGRRKNIKKYNRILERAKELGFVHTPNACRPTHENVDVDAEKDDVIQMDRRWGPFDLDDEDPPPSAIAARKDTVSISMSRLFSHMTEYNLRFVIFRRNLLLS